MQKQALLQAGLLGLQALVWRSVAGVRVMGWMMMTVWTMAGVVLCCGRWQNISTRHNDCQCSKCDTPAGPWRHIATSAPTLKIYRGGHSRHQDIFLAWQNYIWFLASHCIAPCTFVSKHNLHFPLYVTTIDDNSIFHSLIVVFFTHTHTHSSLTAHLSPCYVLEEFKRYKLFCCGCGGIGCLAECVATRPRVSVWGRRWSPQEASVCKDADVTRKHLSNS